MAQITDGSRAILSHPIVYSFFQRLMGAHADRSMFVRDFVRPHPGVSILDMGCGPADILAYLTGADYWGFDISAAYIEQASKRYGTKEEYEALAGTVFESPRVEVRNKSWIPYTH